MKTRLLALLAPLLLASSAFAQNFFQPTLTTWPTSGAVGQPLAIDYRSATPAEVHWIFLSPAGPVELLEARDSVVCFADVPGVYYAIVQTRDTLSPLDIAQTRSARIWNAANNRFEWGRGGYVWNAALERYEFQGPGWASTFIAVRVR